MAEVNRIRIFISSPSDVADERRKCGDVVEELNSTIRALLPEKRVELELVRWEDAFPDVAAGPQDVIDEQLGDDFDIFLGIMWTRFGTPTERAGSGTEHEYRAAYRNWEKKRKPAHILFYFCDAMIPPRLAREQAEQLQAIDKFRSELETKGLIGSYEDRGIFADRVRRDLVSVVSRLLHSTETSASVAEKMAEQTSPSDISIVWTRIKENANRYNRLRAEMPSGWERTRRMEVVASDLRTQAQASFAILADLQASDDPGERLAAVMTLQVIPVASTLGWLAERLPAEKPFIGYHAAVALLTAARDLSKSDLDRLDIAISRAEAYSRDLFPDTDSAKTVRLARAELTRRNIG